MDFTGLHINILARHTLNKNPSYTIVPESIAVTWWINGGGIAG